MNCSECGHRNPSDLTVCSLCGAPLTPALDDNTTMMPVLTPGEEQVSDEELAVAVDELPHGMGLLVVCQGRNAARKYLLDLEATEVGRHPESDIVLDDSSVSRRHAEILRQSDGYVVRDLASLNGTYVNGERVNEVKLTNGDELQLGNVKLMFVAALR